MLITTRWQKASTRVWRPQTPNLTQTNLYEHMIGWLVSWKQSTYQATQVTNNSLSLLHVLAAETRDIWLHKNRINEKSSQRISTKGCIAHCIWYCYWRLNYPCCCMPLLMPKWSLLLHAVIWRLNDPSCFAQQQRLIILLNGKENQQILPFLWGHQLPSNTRFLGPTEVHPQRASRLVQPSVQSAT